MPFICVVCRDKLTLQGEDGELQIIISTLCGHLFHRNCLTENFQKMADLKLELTGEVEIRLACPTCQRDIVASENRLIFPAEIQDENVLDRQTEQLQEENFILKGRIRNLEMRLNAPSASKNQSTFVNPDDILPVQYNLNPEIVSLGSIASGGLKLGDLVIWFGTDEDSHTGVVKWIGRINNELHAGVEFDETIGNDYPESGGVALFLSAPFRGRLVRTRELLLQKDFFGQ